MKNILLAVSLLVVGAAAVRAQDSVVIIDGRSCDRACMDRECTPRGGERPDDMVRVPGGSRVRSCSLANCC